VAVDLRRSSPTFGCWVSETLEASEHRQLWIPPGFAHGFYTLSDSADLLYKCTAYYTPADDRTLRWDDPDLAIPWPLLETPPTLSPKDAAAPPLRDAPTYP
jgi:dTDP-4-dehydrorhamnose 3,5-epimerase